jgi:hypothetical protein
LEFSHFLAGPEEYDLEAYQHLVEALPAPEEYGVQGLLLGAFFMRCMTEVAADVAINIWLSGQVPDICYQCGIYVCFTT